MILEKDDKILVKIHTKEIYFGEEYEIRYDCVRVEKTFKGGTSHVRSHDYRRNYRGEEYLSGLGFREVVLTENLYESLEEAQKEGRKKLAHIILNNNLE